MSEHNQFKGGGVLFPLTSSTTQSALQDADPALYETLAFCASVVSTYLGPRFDAEMTRAGLTEFVGKAASTAVPYNPTPFLTQAQIVPPILALFPVEEKTIEHSRAYHMVLSDWTLEWVLPPLTAAQYLMVYPLLRAFPKVITDRVIKGSDPAYLSGALFASRGGIAQIDIGTTRFGNVSGITSEILFPAVTMEFTVHERRELVDGSYEDLAGTDGLIQTTDIGGSEPLDVINYKGEFS